MAPPQNGLETIAEAMVSQGHFKTNDKEGDKSRGRDLGLKFLAGTASFLSFRRFAF